MKAGNPIWMFLALGIGCFWIYDGLKRGRLYAPLLGQVVEHMTVLNVYNPGGRTIFPNYRAYGQVDGMDSLVVVDLFQSQYRNLRRANISTEAGRGQGIEIYRLDPEGSSWVTASRVDESKPIFTLLGFPFSWHFPTGILMAGVSSLYLWNWRQGRRREQLLAKSRAEQCRRHWRYRESWRRRLELWRQRKKTGR